jgi:hypothetical protein
MQFAPCPTLRSFSPAQPGFARSSDRRKLFCPSHRCSSPIPPQAAAQTINQVSQSLASRTAIPFSNFPTDKRQAESRQRALPTKKEELRHAHSILS